MSTEHSDAGGRRRLLIATTDQGLSSASNFVLVFLLARYSSPADLGIYLIGYGFLSFALVLSRAALGAALGMDLPDLRSASRTELIARSFGAGVMFSCLPIALLGCLLVGTQGQGVASVLMVLAFSAPVVLIQDLYRYVLIADRQPGIALVADGCWLLIAFAALFLGSQLELLNSAAAGVSVWAIGALISISICWALYAGPRMQFRGTWVWLYSDPRRRHLASDSFLAAAAPLVNSGAAAVLVGPAITAAVRSASTLFGPLNILTASLPLAVVPEAKRMSPPRVRKLIVQLGCLLGGVTLVWGLVLFVVPSSVGNAILGATWRSAHELILIVAIEYLGLAMWSCAIVQFRLNNATGIALRFRVVYAASICVFPVLVVWQWQSAIAFSTSLAVLGLTLGSTAIFTARRMSRPS